MGKNVMPNDEHIETQIIEIQLQNAKYLIQDPGPSTQKSVLDSM
jgi:hypothetical protein